MIWRMLTLLLAGTGALLTVGCESSTLRTPEADRVVRRIESGGHRQSIAPTCLLGTRRKLFAVGEDIRVTVRLIAPAETKVLDPYLPIKGRFHVKRQGSLRELTPPSSSARLVWGEIPIDTRRKRDRSFTQSVNRIFPMTGLSWYTIWWEGRDDLGHKVRSGDVYVRIMTTVPTDN